MKESKPKDSIIKEFMTKTEFAELASDMATNTRLRNNQINEQIERLYKAAVQFTKMYEGKRQSYNEGVPKHQTLWIRPEVRIKWDGPNGPTIVINWIWIRFFLRNGADGKKSAVYRHVYIKKQSHNKKKKSASDDDAESGFDSYSRTMTELGKYVGKATPDAVGLVREAEHTRRFLLAQYRQLITDRVALGVYKMTDLVYAVVENHWIDQGAKKGERIKQLKDKNLQMIQDFIDSPETIDPFALNKQRYYADRTQFSSAAGAGRIYGLRALVDKMDEYQGETPGEGKMRQGEEADGGLEFNYSDNTSGSSSGNMEF